MLQMLWADSCRPRTLDQLTYHKEVSEVLKFVAKKSDFSHMIFHGPSGAGKKTRALCFAAEIFGIGVYKVRSEQKSVKVDNTTFEFTTLSSNHHIELTPSDSTNKDRHVIQHVVKQIAENADVQSGHKNNPKFKLLIINEADFLSKESQGALRRTMEKYIINCRIILICQNQHKIIAPIRSRCLNIRIPAPTNQNLFQTIKSVAKSHDFDAKKDDLAKIVEQSHRNMRQAIFCLQTLRHTGQIHAHHPYKRQIKSIWSRILKNPSVAELQNIRNDLYDLTGNCIDPSLIILELLRYACKDLTNQNQIRHIIKEASEHDYTTKNANRPIIHLESFCAVLMEAVLKDRQNI